MDKNLVPLLTGVVITARGGVIIWLAVLVVS
jgi:hypothetical protein